MKRELQYKISFEVSAKMMLFPLNLILKHEKCRYFLMILVVNNHKYQISYKISSENDKKIIDMCSNKTQFKIPFKVIKFVFKNDSAHLINNSSC